MFGPFGTQILGEMGADVGYSPDEIAALRATGVTGAIE
jgi:hypothetical protein